LLPESSQTLKAFVTTHSTIQNDQPNSHGWSFSCSSLLAVFLLFSPVLKKTPISILVHKNVFDAEKLVHKNVFDAEKLVHKNASSLALSCKKGYICNCKPFQYNFQWKEKY